jgi:hypothetical protein
MLPNVPFNLTALLQNESSATPCKIVFLFEDGLKAMTVFLQLKIFPNKIFNFFPNFNVFNSAK